MRTPDRSVRAKVIAVVTMFVVAVLIATVSYFVKTAAKKSVTYPTLEAALAAMYDKPLIKAVVKDDVAVLIHEDGFYFTQKTKGGWEYPEYKKLTNMSLGGKYTVLRSDFHGKSFYMLVFFIDKGEMPESLKDSINGEMQYFEKGKSTYNSEKAQVRIYYSLINTVDNDSYVISYNGTEYHPQEQ